MFEKISKRARVWLFILAGVLPACAAQADDFEFFENRIRPVLVDNCYKCHSATGGKVKGGLLLDTKEGLLKGGDTGPAIVPGEPEKSLLIKAVRYMDKDLQMPPKDKRLADSQIADLVSWVKMGAPDPRVAPEKAAQKPAYDFAAARKQWAFHQPQDPAVPVVKNKRWVKSPIDNFILAKLEEKNLAPAPPADKRTLIRRATFDLTGLPPTPEEVANFLKDKSSGAFAKVVDRLLASPHYGERWGRHWLDVVRYADSADARATGSEGDIMEAYRYRDWVVNAFNQDLPYNQFVREQIAGDLLQPKDPDQIDTNGIIATGLYAIGNWGNGDADKDKILTDIADDQVDVTGRAFLGLTLACARCHDHKFDPIPTADYYSLAGIFFSSHITPKLTPKGQGENMLFIPLASKAELARRQKREARIAELEKQIAATQDEQFALLGKTMLTQSADYLTAAAAFHGGGAEQSPPTGLLQPWVNYLGFDDLKLLSRITHDFADKPGLHSLHDANNADTPAGLINATDKAISYLTITMPARTVAIHPSPKAGVAVGWKSPITGTIAIKGRVVDADPNCGDGIEWKLQVQRQGAITEIASGAIPNGGAQAFSEGKGATNLASLKMDAGEKLSLVVLPKGDYACDMTVVELELTDRDNPKRAWNLTSEIIADANEGKNPYPDSQGHQGVWSIYDMDGQSPLGDVAAGSPMAKWLAAVNRQASKADVAAASQEVQRALQSTNAANSSVSKLYRDLTDPHSAFWAGAADVEKSFSAEIQKTLAAQESELALLRKNPPPALARANGIQEGGVEDSPHAGLHDVKIHMRGRYDHLGDLVPRRFPRLLAGDDQKPITQGSGRLELANWIASPDNPLTARVMVNRIWQHHFGEGIVRTPNNYGKLGVPPTHPELLDYLAHRFEDSGWSIKAMHRAIMLSAAYQQSSIPVPATFKADPDTLLFGRMNRRRLESEALRDSLLDAAGKLDLTLGGPAVRDMNTPRRTLYGMTIRSDHATYQFLFDAADPGAIVEKRIDSTVAPQALYLLNSPFVQEQIKALAQRLQKEAPKDDKGRVKWLYQLLYGRPAGKEEIKLGLHALALARAGTKESNLAWEEYCQVLICANEFLYVD
jgi:mono/diheme cytochrome c family protein